MSLLFPNSFGAKIVCVILVGMGLPLLVSLWVFLQPSDDVVRLERLAGTVLIVEAAALVFTAAAVWYLLQPVYAINSTLRRYARDRTAHRLPNIYRDEVGQLMNNVNRVMESVGRELDAAEKAANSDPLTGLLNRRGFEQAVPSELRGAVFYLDLDNFKRINDEWGHATGDQVLVEFADALSSALRTRDVLARFGGEEFAIFVDEVVDARALDVAERVRMKVRSRVSVKGRPVTVSIGVAVSDVTTSRDALIEAADEANYEAKAAGRDRVSLARYQSAA